MDAIKAFTFILEGENIDGDFLSSCVEFENVESFSEACKFAEKDAVNMLELAGGGHIDIYDVDGKFINDVEV